jgi:hypothetical protein
MKTTKDERTQAEQVSAAVDQLLRDPDAALALPDSGAAEALAAARRMARLPTLLGPPDPAFAQRIMQDVKRPRRSPRPVRMPRLAWVAVGLVAVLLVVMLLTPFGQTAVASLMAVFDLGHTDVRVAPAYTPSAASATAVEGGRAVQQDLTLEEAQGLVSFAIPQPGYLPPDFRLEGVNSYAYPDLPAWVPQPFFVELIYHNSEGEELLLRVYSIALGDEASISSLNLRAPPIEQVEDVDVNGRPGAFLQQKPDRSGAIWRELVWEQGDKILALSSVHLDEQVLLRIARSIHVQTP